MKVISPSKQVCAVQGGSAVGGEERGKADVRRRHESRPEGGMFGRDIMCRKE